MEGVGSWFSLECCGVLTAAGGTVAEIIRNSAFAMPIAATLKWKGLLQYFTDHFPHRRHESHWDATALTRSQPPGKSRRLLLPFPPVHEAFLHLGGQLAGGDPCPRAFGFPIHPFLCKAEGGLVPAVFVGDGIRPC